MCIMLCIFRLYIVFVEKLILSLPRQLYVRLFSFHYIYGILFLFS